MRLTVDVILRARVFINPLKERELDIRGYKIPMIENIGTTKDAFDCIDFSDNEIKKLENFPRMKRLNMLLLHHNHISRIQENLNESIPNLQTLILTDNKLSSFEEIDHLIELKNLEILSLVGNPITKKKFYREYIIYKFPKLRYLDYKKIKSNERDEVNLLFKSMAGKKILQENK